MSNWPDIPSIPAAALLEDKARAVYGDMRWERNIDRKTGVESDITLSDLKAVRDRTGAIWYLREREMDKRQAEREDYVRRYRPIRTFTPEERAARLEAIYDKAVKLGILISPHWVDMKPW